MIETCNYACSNDNTILSAGYGFTYIVYLNRSLSFLWGHSYYYMFYAYPLLAREKKFDKEC